MTKLALARLLRDCGSEEYRWRTDMEMRVFVSDECDKFDDHCHCQELMASLALDGYPARLPRKELAALLKGLP